MRAQGLRLPVAALAALFLATALARAPASDTAAPGAAGLRAGAAKAKITPPPGRDLWGWVSGRQGQVALDELYARALALDCGNGEGPILVVACDLVRIPDNLAALAKAKIKEKTGVPPERVLLCSTHCHSGPNIKNEPGLVAPGIVEAAAAAVAALAPAEFAAGSFEESGIQKNRRILLSDGTVMTSWSTNPPRGTTIVGRGPLDPAFSVLSFRAKEGGKSIAVLLNFTTHIHIAKASAYTAELPAGLTARLEKNLGGVAVYTQGASADVTNWNADALDGERTEIPRKEDGMRQAIRDAQAKVAELLGPKVEKIAAESAYSAQVPVAMVQADFFFESRAKGGGRRGRPSRKAPPPPGAGPTEKTILQALRIGDVGLATAPGELFCSLGLDLKKRSPFSRTLLVGYANDAIDYIPDRKAYDEGGYETEQKHCPGAPGTGEKLVDADLDLLAKLAGKPAKPREPPSAKPPEKPATEPAKPPAPPAGSPAPAPNPVAPPAPVPGKN